MPVAALTVPGIATFSFAVARTDRGRVPEMPVFELEEIGVPGVDYRRHRIVRRVYPPFRLSTRSECSTWDAGVQLAQQVDLSQGQLATLSMQVQGQTYTWQEVLVREAAAELRPGRLIGGGATGSGAAVLACDWVLELTKLR
jgi:hypothetical protein